MIHCLFFFVIIHIYLYIAIYIYVYTHTNNVYLQISSQDVQNVFSKNTICFFFIICVLLK